MDNSLWQNGTENILLKVVLKKIRIFSYFYHIDRKKYYPSISFRKSMNSKEAGLTFCSLYLIPFSFYSPTQSSNNKSTSTNILGGSRWPLSVWIKGLIQKALLPDKAHIVRKFLSLEP